MKCILLCAGYATRLFPLTENFPKALLDIEENKPLLNYIVENVNEIKEVDELFVITNNRYFNHFESWADKLNNSKKITVINDGTNNNDDRLGAIGDIYYTINKMNISDDLLIIAGDNLFDYKLSDVINYFKKKKAPIVVAKEIDDYEALKQFAVVKIDETDKIVNLVEKPNKPESNVAAYATYIYPASVLSEIKEYLEAGNKPDAPGYLVEYLYKKLPVFAYRFKENCFDVGNLKSLEEVRSIYRNR